MCWLLMKLVVLLLDLFSILKLLFSGDRFGVVNGVFCECRLSVMVFFSWVVLWLSEVCICVCVSYGSS